MLRDSGSDRTIQEVDRQGSRSVEFPRQRQIEVSAMAVFKGSA